MKDNIQVGGELVAAHKTTIRIEAQLADQAVRILGSKSRTDAVHSALSEIVALLRFKKLMKKYAGKLEFAGDPLRRC
jgi:Arc/MetJ family transcription regulator